MIWQLICETLLSVAVNEVKREHGADQLCSVLEVDKEGLIYCVNLAWGYHLDEDDRGLLLIGARNASNEGNRHIMVWIVRDECVSGSLFLLNLHRHNSVLVLRGKTLSKVIFLHSKEGGSQGCPFEML